MHIYSILHNHRGSYTVAGPYTSWLMFVFYAVVMTIPDSPPFTKSWG